MALNPSVPAARVYAKALIDIGEETGELPRVYDDLMALVKMYEEDATFRAFFTSPRIEPERKYEILKEALGEAVCRPVLGLLKVMIRKRRELLLDNIADQFARFKDLAEGKVHVFVRTARPLPDDQKEAIRGRVETRTGKSAVLHESVEPELLGGTIVRVGDTVVDGSLRRRLSGLKKSLTAKERMF